MIIKSNKKTRDIAIPFEASPYGGNTAPDYYTQTLNYDGLGSTKKGGSLQSGFDPDPFPYLGPAPDYPTLGVVRCCTPDRGILVEAILTMEIDCGSALEMKVGVGRFNSDDGIRAHYQYTDAEIDAVHFKLTGSNDPFTGGPGDPLFINGLDILPALPKHGEDDFNRDGFVLLFKYDRYQSNGPDPMLPPDPEDNPADRTLHFSVMCSALMGLFK